MVTGVILAAGQAKRMGQAKQLLLLGDKPMLWHVANTACRAKFSEVIVITGAYEPLISEILQDLPLKIIYNENWAAGQATSVKTAVQAISKSAEAVVFLLADQPLVNVALINEVIKVYHDVDSSIIMPRALERPGNPVLFDLKTWRFALLELSGDEGARQIIRKNQAAVHYLELTDEKYFIDIDTPADYAIMKNLWKLAQKTV